MDELADVLEAVCQGPHGKPGRVEVQWCPAWDLYLCADCRRLRTVQEFWQAGHG